MNLNFKNVLTGLALSLSLFACTDHRLGGPSSPVRLRLKSVQGGSLNTTYTYDSQNRLARVTKADGSLRVYSYSTTDYPGVPLFKEYPNPADQTKGTATIYYSNGEAGSYTYARTRPLFNSEINFGATLRTFYLYGNSNRITSVDHHLGEDITGINPASFIYTGENITTANYNTFRFPDHDDTYVYDDKINPFFGMLDPDLSDVELFSRNNVTRIDYTSRQSQPSYMKTYAYDYNAQGLPIRRTTIQGGNEVITYTYETY
ncbi:hypothetical protein [Spirosoma koreense]